MSNTRQQKNKSFPYPLPQELARPGAPCAMKAPKPGSALAGDQRAGPPGWPDERPRFRCEHGGKRRKNFQLWLRKRINYNAAARSRPRENWED